MIIASMAMPRKAGGLPLLPRPYSDSTAPRPSWRPARYVAPLLATLLLVSLAAGADDAVKQKAADLARIKSKIDRVSQSLASDRGRQGHLQSALESTERRLAQSRAEVAKLDDQLQAQDVRLAKARAAHADAEATLHRQQTALAAQLRAAYELGGVNRLQLLLSGQDPGRVGRLLADYGYLAQARARQIESVRQQVQQVAALEQQVGDERDRLDALRRQQQKALAGLQDDRQARAKAVAQLKSRIADHAAKLRQLQASERQVEKLLESLKSTLSSEPYDLGNHTPFAKLRGRLPWPLRGALLARFGAPKADGRLQWKGVWIAAAQGAPVRASARGRVVYVGWISSYGLIVLLQHDGGYFTLYGHNDAANVSVGATVEAGQVIAEAGDSGGYARNGVYFEVRHGKQALNPSDWLAR